MGKRYSLKAIRTLEKRNIKKKIIPLRQNLLWSIRPLPGPIQFFVFGAMSVLREVPKMKHMNQRRDTSKRLKSGECNFVFNRSQTRFAQGELINGSASIWPERIVQPLTINEKALILWVSSLVWGEILTLCRPTFSTFECVSVECLLFFSQTNWNVLICFRGPATCNHRLHKTQQSHTQTEYQ